MIFKRLISALLVIGMTISPIYPSAQTKTLMTAWLMQAVKLKALVNHYLKLSEVGIALTIMAL